MAGLALCGIVKGRAVEAEDFDLAVRLKHGEEAMQGAAAEFRSRALEDGAADRSAALQRLAQRKRKAVEDEDFDLAARVKRREALLAARPVPPKPGELEQLLIQKAEAVAAEDFERATALKERQAAMEAACRGVEHDAALRAASLARAEPGRRSVLRALEEATHGEALSEWVDEGAWGAVRRALASRSRATA